MRRRSLVRGVLAAAATPLVACRRGGLTDLPVGSGAAPSAHSESVSNSEPRQTEATSTVSPSDSRFDALDGFCDGIAAPNADEYAGHVRRMQQVLRESGQAALVAESSATMTWLSGVRWGRSERPFTIVVPAEGTPWFLCPAFEQGTARQQLPDAQLHVWQEHQDPYAVVAKVLGKPKGAIAVDGQLRAFIVEGLRRVFGGKVVDGRPVVDACRMHKTDVELSRLRRANEATKAALQRVAELVTPAMRQSEVTTLVRAAQQRAGLDSVWALVLAGDNAAYPHGREGDRPIGDGELLLVDTGGGLFGYRSDITRTWAIGTPNDAVAHAWEVVAQAQRAALALMRPGARCADVDAAARAVIAKEGFGDEYTALTHRLGHGIGLETHEVPYLRPDNDRLLAPGMTMSNEPGIYRPGEFGVRIEDIVAITEDGHEVFGPLVKSLQAPFG